MELLPSIKEQIRSEWSRATNGAKAEVVRHWASALGCSYQTLYRELRVGRKRKKGERKIEGIEAAALVVAQIKKKPPRDGGEIATDQAIRHAVDNGVIPKEMADVSPSTFNRVMRDLDLHRRTRRVQRYQAEYPNQLHHVDASSSQYFYVDREIELDGGGKDYVLKLHASSGQGYKNKPLRVDRLRPWLYGLTDDYSGVHVARYIAAAGESMADNLAFLQWAWEQNGDKPFFGLPARIKADQGPLMKGEASKDWIDALGIDIDGSIPYAKDAHGKIERPWRTIWARFEKNYFIESGWHKFEITLSELDRQFRNYQQEYNARPHRYERHISRLDAWLRIALRGGAVAIPPNAIGTVARRPTRTVGQDGCFSLDGVTYEVKGLHDARVWVWVGVFKDKIVVEDPRTGEKYDVEKFAPTPLDKFRAHPETPHQKVQKAARALEGLHNTLYTEENVIPAGAGVREGKVARMPTRIKEQREIVNPLSTDTYGSIEAALRDFIAISGVVLTGDNLTAVRDLIIENGLGKQFVRDLALDIQAESAKEEGYAQERRQ